MIRRQHRTCASPTDTSRQCVREPACCVDPGQAQRRTRQLTTSVRTTRGRALYTSQIPYAQAHSTESRSALLWLTAGIVQRSLSRWRIGIVGRRFAGSSRTRVRSSADPCPRCHPAVSIIPHRVVVGTGGWLPESSRHGQMLWWRVGVVRVAFTGASRGERRRWGSCGS
jgi:hypothetical protein